MSDECYKRSNRRSNGSVDGSGSKEWIKEKFEGAMDQGASCSSEKNRSIMSKNVLCLKMYYCV